MIKQSQLYRILEDQYPPKNPKRRHKYYLTKFSSYNTAILNNVIDRCSRVDSFLEQIDSNIENSRQIFSSMREDLEEHNDSVKKFCQGMIKYQGSYL